MGWACLRVSRPVLSCHTTTAASPAGAGVGWGVGWGNNRHRFWAQALFSSACLHVAFSCHRQRPLLSQHSRATARSLPAERRRCLRQPEGQSTSEQCLLKAKSSWGVQPDRGQEAGSGPGSARPRPACFILAIIFQCQCFSNEPRPRETCLVMITAQIGSY